MNTKASNTHAFASATSRLHLVEYSHIDPVKMLLNRVKPSTTWATPVQRGLESVN